MKKVFSNEAALELLNKHRKLLRTLQLVKSFIDRTDKELEVNFSSNKLAHHIVELTDSCLKEGVIDFNDDKLNQFLCLEYAHTYRRRRRSFLRR